MGKLDTPLGLMMRHRPDRSPLIQISKDFIQCITARQLTTRGLFLMPMMLTRSMQELRYKFRHFRL